MNVRPETITLNLRDKRFKLCLQKEVSNEEELPFVVIVGERMFIHEIEGDDYIETQDGEVLKLREEEVVAASEEEWPSRFGNQGESNLS